MNQSRSFAVLFAKLSRIEQQSRPKYKSAVPNWFICQTLHVPNLIIRFGTCKVQCLNRALVSSHDLEDLCFAHYIFKQPLFKVTFFKDIFLWIFNLEQKKFFTHQKKIPCNLVPMILQTKVCVADITQKCRGHYIFGNTFFIIHFLVSVAHCDYVNFFL